MFGPVFEGSKLEEGEKRIKNAVVFLLDSKTKKDKQALQKFKVIEKILQQRGAKEIRLCKTLKVKTRWCGQPAGKSR